MAIRTPTVSDIGRKVVYRAFDGADPEEGIITSLKTSDRGAPAVFVRFKGATGELTPLRKLEYIG